MHLNLISRSTGCRVCFISDSEKAGQDVCKRSEEEKECEENHMFLWGRIFVQTKHAIQNLLMVCVVYKSRYLIGF